MPNAVLNVLFKSSNIYHYMVLNCGDGDGRVNDKVYRICREMFRTKDMAQTLTQSIVERSELRQLKNNN